MANIVWRTSDHTRLSFMVLLRNAWAAEVRHDFNAYSACIDQIKSLPNFPTDYDPVSDKIVIERIPEVISVGAKEV